MDNMSYAAAPPYLFNFDTAHLSGIAQRLYIHSAKMNYTTKIIICKTFVEFLYLCTNNSPLKFPALSMISPGGIGEYKQKILPDIGKFYK